MPEDYAGTENLSGRLKAMFSARRGLRRLTLSGLPAALAIGGLVIGLGVFAFHAFRGR